MSKRAGLIHHVALCINCDWRLDARNAMAAGARHADKTGHDVEIQLGYRLHPDPLNAPQPPAGAPAT